jgi:Na+/proline symporter
MSTKFIQANWEKLLAFTSGVVFVIVMLAVVLAVPTPTPEQWFVFRVVLALAAAGFGAVIPGLIVVHVSTAIRAGGAIALFVVVYALNPPRLVATPTIHQSTSGTGSPAIVSQGDVNVSAEPSTEAAKK